MTHTKQTVQMHKHDSRKWSGRIMTDMKDFDKGINRQAHMKLHQIYHPITATPFRSTPDYTEFAPCDALKPYIRCFWGSEKPVVQEESTESPIDIVTPDTCMDIIFTADFTNNTIDNAFCAMDERAFVTRQTVRTKKKFFRFAIRFYAWGASMFAAESMKNTKNTYFDTAYHFPEIKREIEKRLFEVENIRQLIPVAETLLLNRFRDNYQNPVIFQSVSKILNTKGNLSMTDLKQEALVSSRQMERLFVEYIGVSPKSLAAMVRYQYLWNGFLYHNSFNIADAVYRYGYSDQAHLCHDFKKYHSMSLTDAKEFAMQNVGNIQYNSLRS